MAEQVMQFPLSKARTKLTIILVIVLAVIGCRFAISWYFGNTMAEFFDTDEASFDSAHRAVSWAPNDPLTHWRLADLSEKEFPLDQISQVVKEYETTVSLSPSDYRFWVPLGTAYEHAGDTQKAERAFREAVRLAPSYWYPHWYLGNLILRLGRYDEGFAELQRASEANPEMQSHLFNLAWQVYNNDFESLQSAVGKMPEARAKFSLYLFGRSRYDEGLRVWNSLNEAEKRANHPTGDSVIRLLIEAKRYHQAVDVWNVLAPNPANRAASGKIINGGFGDIMSREAGTVFGWQVQYAPQVQIGIDPSSGHAAACSLRMVFQVRSRLDSIGLSQLVPVEPNTRYELEWYVKTDKLQSAATPLVAVRDTNNDSDLLTSEPAPPGNNDWQRVSISFKTGANTEAIRVRIDRSSCGDNLVCPIFGTVWYDDFDLKPRK